jgi:pyruvate kinase
MSGPRYRAELIGRLVPALEALRAGALELEEAMAEELARVHPEYRDSARNLLHYVSVRRHDLRDLQGDLTALGISSLGRLEAHTLATLDSVLALLYEVSGRRSQSRFADRARVSFRAGPALLARHAQQLLGPSPARRSVRIMVTMPAEAATNPELVETLLVKGMNVMRINCAHDGPHEWAAMADNLREAEKRIGGRCKILVDLAGPKLRTGSIRIADRVIRIRPERDLRGGVARPARAWLTATESAEPIPPDCDAALPISRCILTAARVGDRLEIGDCRGKRRSATVTEIRDESAVAELTQTTYIVEGASLRLLRDGELVADGDVRGLPEVPESIRLYAGDELIVTRASEPGRAARRDDDGVVRRPAQIPCGFDGVFSCVKVGEEIWFDDGKIGGSIESCSDDRFTVRITQAGARGSRLRSEKGINLPNTAFDRGALTPKDLEDLSRVVDYSDMIGLSFVRAPADVYLLEDQLRRLDAGDLGIVLKVETRAAFEGLARLLIAGLRSPPTGVMLARGDLAAEVGFERLAEVQEEILWMCEAAHVPVIWATQVLERLATRGSPSRAEVTDAAMSGRAECVMLNKGPYVVGAVEFLSGVLERMQAHQDKKTAKLRKLSISELH